MHPTLKIKDLSDSQELDRVAMTALRGGVSDKSNASGNAITQTMNSNTVVGNGSTFDAAANLSVKVINTQTASLFNSQLNLDALILGYPSLEFLNFRDRVRG
jgi:hypothetical protein